jgi:hypothetical protein
VEGGTPKAAVVVGATLAILAIAAIGAMLADAGPFADESQGVDLSGLPDPAACEPAGASVPTPARDTDGPLVERRADGHLPMGFNDGAFLADQDTPEESAAMQRAAGSTIWRSVAQWQAVEPQPGFYDFSSTDPFYCAALAAGIAPLIHITTSPEWAADPAFPCAPARCTSPPSPQHLGDLSAFAAAVAARYPHAIAIEAWNEPNLHLFWAAPDPERYVEILRAIHDGVGEVDPAMPLLMGGLSDLGTDDPASGDVALATFLDRALSAGAGDLVDAFNVHLYPQAATPAGPAGLQGLEEAKRVLAARGETGRRIWVTEAGVPAGDAIGRRLQADLLADLYARLEREPHVDAVLFHTLVEPNTLIVGGGGYGWVSQRTVEGDFLPYPVYCEFARELAEPLDCAAPAPSGP